MDLVTFRVSGVSFENFNEHPRQLYMGVPPLPGHFLPYEFVTETYLFNIFCLILNFI